MSSNSKLSLPKGLKAPAKRPMKLYTRIVLFFTIAFSALLVVAFFMVFLFSQQIIQNENRQNLLRFNSYLTNVIDENKDAILSMDAGDRLTFISQKVYPYVKDNALIAYKLSDNQGGHYATSAILDDILSKNNPSLSGNWFKLNLGGSADSAQSGGDVVDTIRYGHSEYYYLGTSYAITGDYTIYIQTVKNLDDSYTFTNILYFIQVVISLIALGIIILLGIYGTKQTLKPLIEIADAAREITGNNLSVRIPATGNRDEIDDLIASLNQMIGRLEETFEVQKQFVSDASHELRIPLTIMQGYVDILTTWGSQDAEVQEEAVAAIADETRNMQHIVDSLLLLTRLENRYYAEEYTAIDLSALMAKSYEDCLLIDSDHLYEKSLEGGCRVLGNESLIRQALRGVLDNSVKYTPAGGTIRLACCREGSAVALTITDTGIGIPEEDLPKVTDRFFRVDDDRSRETGGNGLGLSIIQSIVTLHGGQLAIHSHPGQGTSVCITLPAKNPPDPPRPHGHRGIQPPTPPEDPTAGPGR